MSSHGVLCFYVGFSLCTHSVTGLDDVRKHMDIEYPIENSCAIPMRTTRASATRADSNGQRREGPRAHRRQRASARLSTCSCKPEAARHYRQRQRRADGRHHHPRDVLRVVKVRRHAGRRRERDLPHIAFFAISPPSSGRRNGVVLSRWGPARIRGPENAVGGKVFFGSPVCLAGITCGEILLYLKGETDERETRP